MKSHHSETIYMRGTCSKVAGTGVIVNWTGLWSTFSDFEKNSSPFWYSRVGSDEIPPKTPTNPRSCLTAFSQSPTLGSQTDITTHLMDATLNSNLFTLPYVNCTQKYETNKKTLPSNIIPSIPHANLAPLQVGTTILSPSVMSTTSQESSWNFSKDLYVNSPASASTPRRDRLKSSRVTIWHPACTGYRMRKGKATGTHQIFDPELRSPIFFGYTFEKRHRRPRDTTIKHSIDPIVASSGMWGGFFHIKLPSGNLKAIEETFELIFRKPDHKMQSVVSGHGRNQFGSFEINGIFDLHSSKCHCEKRYVNQNVSTTSISAEIKPKRKRINQHKDEDHLRAQTTKWFIGDPLADEDRAHHNFLHIPEEPTKGEPRGMKRARARQKIRKFVLSLPLISRAFPVDEETGHQQTLVTGFCDVCQCRGDARNRLLDCMNCHTIVHQRCYGINADPVHDLWCCQYCEAATNVHETLVPEYLSPPIRQIKLHITESPTSQATQPVCVLCPRKGGAVKPTSDGKWAHIHCAIMHPEVCFLDDYKLEPIGFMDAKGNKHSLTELNHSRFGIACVVCGSDQGLCMRCSMSGCTEAFHASCARESKLFHEVKKVWENPHGYIINVHCPLHSNQSNTNELPMVEWKYIEAREETEENDQNKEIYEGEVVDGKRHGFGVCIYSNGDMYEGFWREDKPHGYGTLTDVDDLIIYEGEFHDGEFSGWGTYLFYNGSYYSGEWRDNLRHGRGVFQCRDGDMYDGEWKENQRHGWGTAFYNNSRRYDGEWQFEKENGQGLLVDPSGFSCDGQFRDGKIEGRGVAIYPDGSRYEGMWKNGKREGRGALWFTMDMDSCYEGKFKEDEIEGMGALTFSKPTKRLLSTCGPKENECDSAFEVNDTTSASNTMNSKSSSHELDKDQDLQTEDFEWIIPIDYQSGSVENMHLRAGFDRRGN